MGSEYKLRIEASYPRTENDLLEQCELEEFFTDNWKDIDKESEIVKDKEYIYWEGNTEGPYSWINYIAEHVRTSLVKQLKAMSDGQQTEQHLQQLRVKCYVIDLQDWDEVKGDKEL